MARGVFLHREDSIYNDLPAEQYQFPSQYLSRASQFVDDWVIYYEPRRGPTARGYFAIARVERIVPDPTVAGMYVALMMPGTYLQFDRTLWLRFNLLDFSVFLGWPLTVWLGLLAWRGRNTRKTGLLFALAAILIAIDLSDITRSETGRLWMPLMPLALAATGVAASSDDATSAEWTLVATLLAITSMALVLYWAQ